ncbi:hypothetical protein LEP1GSC088_4816 [Leptospira interrogans str. L1207]|nr:hypothetical protein LEP1GSC088_4816 [Leptospira interrogans str. L1207]
MRSSPSYFVKKVYYVGFLRCSLILMLKIYWFLNRVKI